MGQGVGEPIVVERDAVRPEVELLEDGGLGEDVDEDLDVVVVQAVEGEVDPFLLDEVLEVDLNSRLSVTINI